MQEQDTLRIERATARQIWATIRRSLCGVPTRPHHGAPWKFDTQRDDKHDREHDDDTLYRRHALSTLTKLKLNSRNRSNSKRNVKSVLGTIGTEVFWELNWEDGFR